MKNWLFSINILFLFSFILACPGAKSPSTNDSVKSDSLLIVDTIVTYTYDSMGLVMDSSIIVKKDSIYQQQPPGGKEAPKHHTPDDAKLDSLKKEKAKKKQ